MLKYNKSFCILLTACVNPNGMSFTVLQDPEERKNQYIDALDFYLENTDAPIVFVENSGCNLSDRYSKHIASKRLEMLTFQGNDFDKSIGKGYGETLIILYAHNHSSIIRNSKYVIKITGRLIIKNINEVVPEDILCQDNVVICDFQPNVNLLTTIFIISPELLADVCKKGLETINDSKGKYFEHNLYEFICKSRDTRIIPFRRTPVVYGICGSSGQHYSEGLAQDRTSYNIEHLTKYYKDSSRPIDAAINDIIVQYIHQISSAFQKEIDSRQQYIDEITDIGEIKQKQIETLIETNQEKQNYIEVLEVRNAKCKDKIDKKNKILKIVKTICIILLVLVFVLSIELLKMS